MAKYSRARKCDGKGLQRSDLWRMGEESQRIAKARFTDEPRAVQRQRWALYRHSAGATGKGEQWSGYERINKAKERRRDELSWHRTPRCRNGTAAWRIVTAKQGIAAICSGTAWSCSVLTCGGMARNGWVAYCGGGVQNRTDGSGDGYDLI